MQPTLFGTVRWSVTTLTRYIREALESDPQLQDVWVQGEVSNLSRPASGHIYFTLKDGGAALRCVAWKSTVPRLGIAVEDGLALMVHGRIGVYEGSGQYQLYVDQAQAAGEGARYQEFLRLKSQLEAEGLFDPERKRPIPDLPSSIGIVTSATGAALQDVLNTLRRRLPLAQAILAAAAVQGDGAPPQLVTAIRRLNDLRVPPDVILLVRGGGSIEDLWAFNDERVVRAVAASAVPTICGVGHETDFTLCDFAADLRAPTPTAAAEVATSTTIDQLRSEIRDLEDTLVESAGDLLAGRREQVQAVGAQLAFHTPRRLVEASRQRLDEFSRRLGTGASHRLALHRSALDAWHNRLAGINPLSVLGRGYAIVTRKTDGAIVTRVAQARGGLAVRVSDGSFEAEAHGPSSH
jgi:exodeoxyribonuclease VII large subunit